MSGLSGLGGARETGHAACHVLKVIWLILPELMCSFQRLSHACISTRLNKVKPRTAHYNSYNLLDLEQLLG